jgi:hypothetical protein
MTPAPRLGPVQEVPGPGGRWFEKKYPNDPDGPIAFDGRLLPDNKTFEVGWSDHVAETAQHVREVEQLTGVTVERIVGTASDVFEEWINAAKGLSGGEPLDGLRLLNAYNGALGGNWSLTITPKAGPKGPPWSVEFRRN